jgi:hypothetical protein
MCVNQKVGSYVRGMSANRLQGFERFNLPNESRREGVRHRGSAEHLVRLEEEERERLRRRDRDTGVRLDHAGGGWRQGRRR